MMEMGSFQLEKSDQKSDIINGSVSTGKSFSNQKQQAQEDLNVDIDIEDLDLDELKDEDKFFLI